MRPFNQDGVGPELPDGSGLPVKGPVGRNPLTLGLLWCAGVDKRHIVTVAERYRYAGAGFFILLVAAISGFLFVLFGSTIMGGFRLTLIPLALVWSLLIFWIDRSIMSEPRYGRLSGKRSTDSMAAAESKWRPDFGFVKYLLRMVIAVGVAFVMAEFALLLIFQAEIREEITTSQADPLNRIVEDGKTNDAIVALEQRIEVANKRVADADAAVKTAQADFDLEVSGKGGSGSPGWGPIAAAKWAELERRTKVAGEVHKQVAAENTVTGNELAQKRIEQREKNQREIAAIRQNQGWIKQEAALHQFIARNNDNLLVRSMPWVLRVVFIAIDLLPLSIKVLSGRTLYDRNLRHEAELQAYRRRQDQEAEEDEIDAQIDLRRLTCDAAAKIKTAQLTFHQTTRLRHFDRNGW